MPTEITCTRRLQFCLGHRVYQHESKCNNMHGHNYIGFFTASAHSLDSIGRVVDFSVLKERIGGWIDEKWDHQFLVYEKDTVVMRALELIGGKYFKCPFNPTAENMAEYLLNVVGPSVLPPEIHLVKVVLHETENGIATAEHIDEVDGDHG